MRFILWFEEVRGRAACLGIYLEPMTVDEVQKYGYV